MKFFSYITLMLIVLALCSGCPSPLQSVTLTINPLSVQLNIGQSTSFTVNSSASGDSISWQTSNADIATVDTRGRVSAVNPGTARITASSSQSSVRVSAMVTVVGSEDVAMVSVSPSEATIVEGGTIELAPSTTRVGGTFFWFSNDEQVATVNASGTVTGVAPGTVDITVRGDSPEERAVASITVVEAVVHIAAVHPVGASILMGGEIQLSATSTDPDDSFTWNSESPATATVDADGVVTGVGSGGVIINAVGTNSGARGRAIITVDRPIEHRVSVSPSTITMAAGDRLGLVASSTRPGDTFSWTSEDATIASVDQSGFVSGVSEGTVSITAQGSNPDERGVAMVRVVAGRIRIASVRPLSASIPAGETVQLSATSRDPGEAFAWSSGDTSIATIDELGVVTGVAPGTVQMTAVGTTTGATGQSSVTVTAPVVHEVSVAPSAASIEVGDTVTFSAASTRAGDEFDWLSSNTTVATVDAAGVVTGLGAGVAMITATGQLSGVSANAEVMVSEPVLQTVSVRPLSATFSPGGTFLLQASSTDPLDTIDWASGDEAVATVDSNGLVTGLAPGSAMVTATGSNSGEMGTATITITQPVVHQVRVLPTGASIEIGDTVRLGANSTRTGDSFSWSSEDPAVASVDATGLVTGQSAGVVAITVSGTLSGVSAISTITVTEPAPKEAIVLPIEASILVGDTVALAAESSDANDEFTWDSGDEAVATVDATGLVTGEGAGTATVTATGSVSSAAGTSTITVAEPVVHIVGVAPSSATIFPDDVLQMMATTTREGDTFTWSSSNTGVATVNATGQVTGLTAGTTTITAQGSVANEQGSATVTVVLPQLDTVRVQPISTSIVAGETVPLSATSSNGSDGFTWESSNPAVATVDSQGLVSGLTPGSCEITATGTTSGAFGVATVTVTAPTVHIVTASPMSATIEVASSVVLSATSTDSADSFLWNSASVSTATVSGNGQVTGVSPGTVVITVTGTNSGMSSSASITVVDATVHEVAVDPATAILFAGDTVTLSAMSTDDADAFTWDTANGAIATVSDAGVVTGVGAGIVEITATGTNSAARASAQITVNAHVVTVAPPTLALLAGNTAPLTATSTDTGESIQWSTGNPSVATVSASGTVTGVSGGTVEIRGTGARSRESATATVTVLDGVAVNPPSATLIQGSGLQMSADSTDNADTFAWSSSNSSIATVNSSGRVTAISRGTAQITATGSSSGVSASAAIQVVALIPVTPTTTTVEIGRIVPLLAAPPTVNDTLNWTSADNAIATVNQSGVVTGVSVGSTTITVIATPSGATGMASVQVLPEFPNFQLFDGEADFASQTRSNRNTTEAFRGEGCLEGIPDQFAGFNLRIKDEFFRSDISRHDEIWMMIKAQGSNAHASMFIRSFRGVGDTIELTDYAAGGAIGSAYQLLRIPIADLKSDSFDLSLVEMFAFGKRLASENFRFFIDDVWAVNLDSVDSNGGPVVGPLSSVDFGSTSVVDGATRNVTVSNIGASTLEVSGIVVEGSSAFVATPTTFSVSPGGSRQVSVSFSPDMAGDFSGTMVIQHNATAFGDSTQIPLTGAGVSPRLALSRTQINFGSIPLLGNVIQPLTFTNTGNASLSISSLSASTDDFSADTSGFTLSPGQSREVLLTATPSLLGSADGLLNFTTNDPNQAVVSLPLTMTSLAADVLGRPALEALQETSSSVQVSWGEWALADSVRVLVGPEPPATPGGALPLEYEVAVLPGDASSYEIEDIAAGVHAFVRVELSLLGIPIAASNMAIETPGGPRAVLDNKLREVHMFAPNIIQLVMADLRVHSFREDADFPDMGIDEVIGYTGPQWEAGPWVVRRADGSEIAVTNVYRHSQPVGANYFDAGFSGLTRDNLLDVDHMIYLELAENVGSPEILQITGPSFSYEILNPNLERENRNASLDVLLPFSDRYLTTPVIQVNQVGYSPAATRRYAYLSGWMGSGGPLDLSGFPATAGVVAESSDPLTPRSSVLTNLPINLRSALDRDAGTEVRDIDIAALPESDDAIYHVHVPGVGVSWPTRVSEEAVFEVFYHVARGMFHNRWAGNLAPEFTDWSRPVDHGSVYTSENLEPFMFFPEDTPLVGERPLLGGHHDAGDFDIRIYHGVVPQMLMRAYEINASAFTDGQLYIPESGNGIPDLLDEALWSIAAWEYLQEDDGGVRIGAESSRHPVGIYFASDDELIYWTFSREPHFTARCAGLFAQASRLLQPFDGIRAHMLRQRAVRAYDYAIANGVNESAGGTIMFAASELFRLTGEEEYRDQVIRTWDAFRLSGVGQISIFDREIVPTRTFTETVQPITWDYISAYIGSGDVVPDHLENVTSRLSARPSQLLEVMESAHAHRNARPATFPLTFGKGTAVGQYIFGSYASLQYGDLNDAGRQLAFDTMSLSADYVLGCNPAGMSWITGLGSRRPLDPLHLDSLSFINAGIGPIPGIPVYGPADNLRQEIYYIYGVRLASPAYADSPPARRYGDVHTFVISSEFTVWECQAPTTQLFGSLIAPGMTPPEDWLPAAARAAQN